MLMTEVEARGDDGKGGIMCPMSAASPKPFPCRGARCTAWRWSIWPADVQPAPKAPVGRCGLAGDVHLPTAFPPQGQSTPDKDVL